ncbi:hypothetical protein ACJHW0_15250 [Escherichia sp. WS1620]
MYSKLAQSSIKAMF